MQSEVPSIEQLTQAITQMILQKSQARDVLEAIDKQLPVLQGQLQLLQKQAQEAEAASKREVPADVTEVELD